MMKVDSVAKRAIDAPVHLFSRPSADQFCRLAPRPSARTPWINPATSGTPPQIWINSDLPLPPVLQGHLHCLPSGASSIEVDLHGKQAMLPVPRGNLDSMNDPCCITLRLAYRSSNGRGWCYRVQPASSGNPSCMGRVTMHQGTAHLARDGMHPIRLLGDAPASSGDLVLAQWVDEADPTAGARWLGTVQDDSSQSRTAHLCRVALACGARIGFPRHVLEEAAVARPLAAANVMDLTGLPFVSLDPYVSQVCDQAFYIEPHPNGDGAIVHYAVADAAAWVAPCSALDAEARRRGATVYLPCTLPPTVGPGFPMLPHDVGHKGASLKAHRPCPAFVVSLHVPTHGDICNYSLVRGNIRSRAELTYEQYEHLLLPENQVLCAQEPYGKSLAMLPALGGTCVARAAHRGVTMPPPRNPIANWNQHLSMLANEAVAHFLDVHGVRAPYVTSGGLMSPRAVPHAQLHLTTYVRFTAPLRRYSDLITQRIVGALLADEPPPYQDAKAMQEILDATFAAQQRQRAIDARIIM